MEIAPALVAAFIGGAGAGLATVYASHAEQRRQARAEIMRHSLRRLHDAVAKTAADVDRTGEPIDPEQEGPLGDWYSDLVRDARVAGGADTAKVRLYWPPWHELTDEYEDFAAAFKRATGGDERQAVVDRYLGPQQEKWGELLEVVGKYERFLAWKLTRPSWYFWKREPPKSWSGLGTHERDSAMTARPETTGATKGQPGQVDNPQEARESGESSG